MKYTMLLFLTFFVATTLLQADNWDLFPPNQVTYFHFTGEKMDAISPFYVDAVETVNDTEYQYILRAYMENISGGCYETLTTNDLWNETNYRFPNEVMVKQNGWYGETVFEVNPASPPSMIFNVLANVGDKWLIESETYQDFDQIEVECVSMESENFLDVADNVKTFHLQALQNGTPVSSNFNDIVLKISEQYGLISGIPLKELRQNAPTTQMQLVGFEDENGDLHGRTLQHTPLLQSSIEVDLSEQPNGIYLVQISDGKSWWTEKVLKH
ncbi:MAG: T9SS type A sorting domain-containing protein [Chitinophagales bacterium]